MDANTASVIISIVTLVISPIILFLIQRANAKQIKAVSTQVEAINTKVEVVDKKLDENHKQQNGNLTKLLETTKELATATEKAKHEGENKETKP